MVFLLASIESQKNLGVPAKEEEDPAWLMAEVGAHLLELPRAPGLQVWR